MPITENATTVAINGVTAVEFDRNYPYFNIRNDGNDTIYVSTSKADCPKDADGVISVPPGGSYVAFNSKIGNVFLYLNGSGKASVIGKYDGSNSFKAARGGGDNSLIQVSGISFPDCFELDIATTGILIEEE